MGADREGEGSGTVRSGRAGRGGAPEAASEGLPRPGRLPRPWQRAYPRHVPTTWAYPDVAVTRLLDDAAADFPGRPAWRCGRTTRTFRELLDAVDRFAVALGALGIGPGERVGVLLPAEPAHLVTLLATWRCGASVVPVDPDAAPAEMASALSGEGCRVVVCAERGYPALAALKGRLPGVRHVVAAAEGEGLAAPAAVVARARAWRQRRRLARDGVHRMDHLITAALPAPPEGLATSEAEALVLRRGTARVALSHGNLVASAIQVRLWLPDVRAGDERVLAAEPLHDALGVVGGVALALLTAASLELPGSTAPTSLVRAARRGRPTLAVGGPAALEVLAEAEEGVDLAALRAGLCVAGHPRTAGPGGAEASAAQGAAQGQAQDEPTEGTAGVDAAGVDAAGVDAVEAVARALSTRTGGRVRTAWGVPAAPVVTANPLYGRAEAGTLGVPLPDTVCTLRDPFDPGDPADPGHPADPGEPADPAASPPSRGRVAVAGPQVARWPTAAGAEEATGAGAWLVTGLVASLDERGYLAPTAGAQGPSHSEGAEHRRGP